MKYDGKTLKKIGRILAYNKMETVPPGEERLPNPLYNVRVWKDEIEALKKGEMPDDWRLAT